MKWLTTNWTTVAMALILSFVTVGLLATPGEVDTFKVTAEFRPDVRAEVGSLQYEVEGAKITDYVTITVTANRNDLTPGLRIICQPLLDSSKFPSDVTVRTTEVDITPKDFNLTSEMARRIEVAPFKLKIEFAPMTTAVLPVQVSAADILDAKDSRYRVVSVRAEPSFIKVRLPYDKAQTLTYVPVRPIRIVGRTESFLTEGLINTDLADYRDVRRQENFSIRVVLRLMPAEKKVDGIPLYLAAPSIPGLKAELLDVMTFKVVLSGAEDVVNALAEKPELIMVYVRLDKNNWKEGTHSVPVKCDVPEELRKDVSVQLDPGEPIVASVRVTRS